MEVKNRHIAPPEIWAGIECSFNRIGDQFSDQLLLSGHYDRPDDIDRFARLGIKALHYPILWERHQPDRNGIIQWDWAAAQLAKMQSHGITPIVSLVHHGSGPAFTHLLDDEFPVRLSAYAKQVATRFPWVTHYKPINEPLTTARFSGLYGLWHPHAKDDAVFAKILLNELKAIVLSMQEIRKVNPEAKLIQTEDLAKTYSTPSLQYQADFENHRRWLTYDILMGKLDRRHPLWNYFTDLGIVEKSLLFFQEHPCTPDVLGVNHYVTSERFLDDDLSRYPPHLHGGNGVHAYADVEAIRINHGQKAGLKVLLQELSERYPKAEIALTEVHLHCSREEQLRWLKFVWDTCLELSQKGIKIKAFTVWSLLGAFGWNRLLTQPNGDYESGIFDLRSPTPRPTALAEMVRSLSRGITFDHPVLKQKGWWQKEDRFIHPIANTEYLSDAIPVSQPLLIIGKNGTLGRAFGIICRQRGINYRLLSRREVNICDAGSVEAVFKTFRPWAVINGSGYTHVDAAELEPHKCFDDNVIGIKNLIDACKKYGVKLLTFSSAMVFDGTKNSPYLESDRVSPLNIYGKSKAEAENLVLNADCRALIIRTGWFFSPWSQADFLHHLMTDLYTQTPCIASGTNVISPVYVPDLVNMSLDLLIDDAIGLWHLTNRGEVSWMEFVRQVAHRTGQESTFSSTKSTSLPLRQAIRPIYSALGSEKGNFLPSLEDALDRYFAEKNFKTGMTAVI